MKISLILCLATLSTQAVADQVCRCTTDKGKTVFNQYPCGDDAATIEVETQPSGSTTQDSIERRNENLKALDEQSKRLKRRRLEARVKSLEGSRNALAGKRDKQISKLQDDLRDAYDFREKAVIESKIEEVRHHIGMIAGV